MTQYLLEVHKFHEDQREGSWTTKETLPMVADSDSLALMEASHAIEGHKLTYRGKVVILRSDTGPFRPWRTLASGAAK